MRRPLSSGPPGSRLLLTSGSFLILLMSVVKNELRDVVAELEAFDVIEAKVLSGEDPAEPGLGRHVAVAVEGPQGAWQGAGRDLDVLAIAEDGSQHGRAGGADGAMGAWIRGVGSSQRECTPVGVADGCGGPDSVRLPD